MRLHCRKVDQRWVIERNTYAGRARFSFDTFDEALNLMRTFVNRHAMA